MAHHYASTKISAISTGTRQTNHKFCTLPLPHKPPQHPPSLVRLWDHKDCKVTVTDREVGRAGEVHLFIRFEYIDCASNCAQTLSMYHFIYTQVPTSICFICIVLCSIDCKLDQKPAQKLTKVMIICLNDHLSASKKV
jgi:hypothetical protein